jgi:hypothetical protein
MSKVEYDVNDRVETNVSNIFVEETETFWGLYIYDMQDVRYVYTVRKDKYPEIRKKVSKLDSPRDLIGKYEFRCTIKEVLSKSMRDYEVKFPYLKKLEE